MAGKVNLLLVKRADEPDRNYWALPETFMREDESAENAALRLVKEKIGLSLSDFHTEQLATFTNVKRASKRSLSLAYMTFLPEMPQLIAGYGATDAKWFTFDYEIDKDQISYLLKYDNYQFRSTSLKNEREFYNQRDKVNDILDRLAYDHTWIWTESTRRIRNKLNYQPNILLILGDSFTLKEARQVFSTFLGMPIEKIDNSNFKKNHTNIFEEIGFSNIKQKGRPAKVYRLNYL